MWNLSRILPLFLCFLPVFTEVYLNKWAVHIKGGHGAARQLAEKHGFHYVGQIGTLDDYYLLEHHGVSKRSTDAAHHHHSRLQDDEQVHWVEQQIVKKRVKRDLMVHGLPASALPFIDPEWNHQWYLHGGATGGYDMNVIPAWRRGYTGKGIVVTILDDGIERTHPDLSINYDPDASWDINSGDDDPMPRYDSFNTNRHGTRCAGEVAAKANNSYCVVGVAYNSRIGGVRMLDGDVSDYVEAQSLSLNPQHIDIYSASWGPDDNGSVVDGPAKLAMEAFIKGVLEGRNGKGSIFVWASGNGGSHFDSCNCDGYTNSIFTLSISSTSEHGTKPWYLEECSSTLATTYSSGQNYGERKIVTTDLHKKCTDAHTGTSASAPLAAGIVALALEANNDLTWRDMQYLVMLTARSEPFVDGKWRTNGIGRKFSHRYGYGLMDAAALVTLAERWKPVPEQHICMSEVMPVNKQITGHKIEVEVTSSGCMDTVNEIHYLEHVQAKISLKYTHRGDLQLHLVSPNGTRTTLLQKRQKDIHEREFHDWPFMSVHFWGEKPFGTWKLEVENVGKPENTGTLVKWQLILYGVSEDPYTPVHDHKTSGSSGRKNGGAEKSDDEAFVGDYENEVPEWRYEVIDQSVVHCHEECDEDAGCQGPEASDCYMCKHVRMRMNGPCVPNCPKGYFADLEAGVCGRCTTPCESCEGTGQEDCLSCIDGYYYLPNEAVCVTQCPDGSSPDEDSRTCATCSDECKTCVVGQADACTGCYGDLVVVGDRCMPPCQSHQFPDLTGRCRSCSSDCVTCHGLTRNDCDSCQAYLYLQGSTCVRNCDDGFHPAKSDDNINICQRCPVSCRLCASDEVCSACTSGYQLDGDRCVPICPDGQYQHTNGDCKPCAPDCLTCTGGSAMDCVECADDRSMLSGRCIPNCPDGQFVKMQPSHGTAAAGGETVECEQCHVTCASCRDGSSTSCISCPGGRSLHSGSCVRDCAHGFHSSPSGCLPCHTSCATCTAGDEQHCTACSSGHMLLHGQCLDQCPRGYFAAEGDCKQCHSSCLACTGPASSDCSRCLHGQSLQNGICHSGNVTTCPPKFYWNSKNKVCESCDRTCATCQGPGTNNCLSCHPPLKYYYRHHLCVLCCADGNSHGCCNCHPDTGVCMEIRNIVEPNDIKGVDSHQYPHSKSAPHEESFSHLFVGSIVFVGIFSVSSFLVVFGLLQARSHGRLCWSHKYERIPLYYSGRFAKLDLLSNGQKDHDEEEEEDDEDEQTETYNA